MKFKVTFAAMALCLVVSSQSYGQGLLDRLVGGSGCGCDTSCCATPEPTCGCEGIGKLRGRFFNRACDAGCAAKPAAPNCGADKADNGCDSGDSCCRPKLFNFDVKCLSIPVIIPKINLPKICLPKICMKSCCDSGCDKAAAPNCGCDKKAADPNCGCDKAKAGCGCGLKMPRLGLLDRMKCRPKMRKCGCDTAAEPTCGTDAPKPSCGSDAPAPEAAASTGAVPPAPVVDPAAFGGIQAQTVSETN